MKRTVITISREFCSGGRLIAAALSEKLGIPLYDKELITLAAAKSGFAPEFIENAESRRPSSYLFGLATVGGSSVDYAYEMPTGDKAFMAQSSAIRELAEKGSGIFIGRCSSFILRDDPDRISVFIHDNLTNRMKRAAEVYNLSGGGIAEKILKTDKRRAGYCRHYTGEAWNDIKNYDLSINTGTFGIDAAVDMLVSLVSGR